MRVFIVIVALFALGTGVALATIGWLDFFTWPNTGETDGVLIAHPIDIDAPMKHRTVDGLKLADPAPPPDEIPSVAGHLDRQEYHQAAERRLQSMDLNLLELTAKAKRGETVTKEKMIEAIDRLTKRTAEMRRDLGELRAATAGQWEPLKMRLDISLQKLEDGFEQTFSRYMSESAQLGKTDSLL